jgi:hypothetical protein
MGRGAKIMSGTVRDSLHMIDVIFGLDGGDLPEIVVTDTGSYSDVVFGLLELLGISYRPALADLPDQKGWRIKADADYGPQRDGHRPRWGRRSRCTAGSSRPCTSSATSTPTKLTGAISRASATCRRAATP